MWTVKRLIQLVLISVVLAGCAVRPAVEEPAEPMTASQELEGSPALGLLSRAEQARQQGQTSVGRPSAGGQDLQLQGQLRPGVVGGQADDHQEREHLGS